MPQPKWVSVVLAFAASHCLGWGVFILVSPETAFRFYGFAEELKNPTLWRGSGLTICLYGLGYALASTDPARHYGLVLLGLTAKICGGLGILWGYATGVFLPQALFWVFVNDVIWFLPLGWIVRRACKSGID